MSCEKTAPDLNDAASSQDAVTAEIIAEGLDAMLAYGPDYEPAYQMLRDVFLAMLQAAPQSKREAFLLAQ